MSIGVCPCPSFSFSPPSPPPSFYLSLCRLNRAAALMTKGDMEAQAAALKEAQDHR